jgi:hypothetical protein
MTRELWIWMMQDGQLVNRSTINGNNNGGAMR